MSTKDFRDYQNSQDPVREHYRKMRTNQTLNYVKRMKKKYLGNLTHPMTFWEVFEKLEHLIDVSDPDLIGIPNVHHAFQTAEKVRQAGHPEWLQITALIHDTGKIMYLWGCDQDGTSNKEQWGLVGDTFVVGCQLPDKLVLPEFNKLNPDMDLDSTETNTKLGIYQPHCGFDTCQMAWGHDEYLYQVLKYNQTMLPEEALYIIRYHSLYPWHDKGSYDYLADQRDQRFKPLLKMFSGFDLYSKDQRFFDYTKLKKYYENLLAKFFSNEILFW